MTRQQSFGGKWTQDKLARLQGYLEAYVTIFKNQAWATTIYVDAFAGTGTIPVKPISAPSLALEPDEPHVVEFLEGSARIALSVEPPFAKYLFIEKTAAKARELEQLRVEYPDKANRIQVAQAEANTYLLQWIEQTDWRTTRAVVFLDPYGMQVEWRLLEAIAATKAIDLWLLVPIGMGANRLMTQQDLPPQEWQERLTTFFGTDAWQERFYRPVAQPDLFGEGPTQEKTANYEELAAYFAERLRLLFGAEGVAPNPLTQRNSRNSPMFLLCFASTNKTGVKIADWLLTNTPKRKRDPQ